MHATSELPLLVPYDGGPLERLPTRTPWSDLLKRVFAVDVTVCPLDGCSGTAMLAWSSVIRASWVG